MIRALPLHPRSPRNQRTSLSLAGGWDCDNRRSANRCGARSPLSTSMWSSFGICRSGRPRVDSGGFTRARGLSRPPRRLRIRIPSPASPQQSARRKVVLDHQGFQAPPLEARVEGPPMNRSSAPGGDEHCANTASCSRRVSGSRSEARAALPSRPAVSISRSNSDNR